MRTQEIQFDGNTYVCRVVKSNEGEDLLIGSTKLLDTLHPGSFEDENEGLPAKRRNGSTMRFSSSQTIKRSGFRTTNWLPNSRRAIPNGSTKANHNQ